MNKGGLGPNQRRVDLVGEIEILDRDRGDDRAAGLEPKQHRLERVAHRGRQAPVHIGLGDSEPRAVKLGERVRSPSEQFGKKPRIRHIAGEGASMVAGGRQGQSAVKWHQSVRRLEGRDAAKGSGNTKRTTGVGAERGKTHPRRDRDRRATGGAA